MLKIGVLSLALLAPNAWATKINGVEYNGNNGSPVEPAAASPKISKSSLAPDRALRLKKIFLFPTIDDLNGALAPRLDEKLFTLFSSNTRFEVVRDSQVIKALSPDESTYYKVAQDQSVHREAAKVTGADTTILLRTHNVGQNTRMTLELRDADGALLFAEEGSVPGSASMEARWGLIEKLYRGMLARLPYEGTITGRTANTITVDLGQGQIQQGEVIDIARIVSVQRHPLLGTVIGTDYARTGKAKITNVDRVLSFAEVQDEASGEKIEPGQKVLRTRSVLIRRGEPESEERADDYSKMKRKRTNGAAPVAREEEKDPFESRVEGDFDKPKARYGLVGGNLYYGTLGHSQSVGAGTTEYSGSGIGGDLAGELWVTKNWIFSANYGFHNANLSGTGGLAGSTSWSSYGAVGGYRIFPDELAEGMELTGSVGFQMTKFQVPTNTSLALGAKKYSGIIVRADGAFNFLEHQKITVGFSIQPFASLTEEGYSLGSPDSASMIGVHLAWNRLLMDKLWLRVGMRYEVANGNYIPTSTSVSNKHFAIGPGIDYLF